jgi:hypothetical protein
MFSYAPTVDDRSGEILGAGQMQAAATNAQAMNQMGQDIGGALASIGGAYMEYEDMKSGVKSGEKLLEVMGPSFGMTSDKLKQFDYSNMSLRDKFKFHQGWQGNFATMSQGYNFGRGLDQRADQPFVNQGLDNVANIASGNQTFTGGGGGGGMAPVEPPLPMGEDTPLPPNAGAPNIAPSATPIPGAQRMTPAQWDAMNADLVRRGRQSRGAYPY